jgi:uncharacterized membrane protein YeaQ/YmgE (transglycosylase-associated protein family)
VAGLPIVAICLLHQRLLDRSIFCHTAVGAILGVIGGFVSSLFLNHLRDGFMFSVIAAFFTSLLLLSIMVFFEKFA